MFFSKTSKIKQEPLPEKNSFEVAIQTNRFEGVKEEFTNHETKKVGIDFEGNGTDDKSKVQSMLNKGAEECGTKRNYEQFAMKSEFPDTIKKPSLNDVKKQKNPKSTEERQQQTLLSYFGRK